VAATQLTRLALALEGRYAIERELGRGGMATVYLARDLKHDRAVALKVLRAELSAIVGAERFLQEIRLTAGLQHPHILPLLDSGEAAAFLYYVMPYVEGEALRQRLSREGQLPLDEALRLTREVADALDYAHQQGIIHRDIKPENILLSRDHALVADFGIAKPPASDGATALTETGLVLGTAAYMSPEQAAGHPVTAASDVYSLGCVLFEMLAGHPPFLAPTPQAALARRFTEPVPSIRVLRHDVPTGVDAALRRALSRSPEERYGRATAFAEALSAPREPALRVARWSLAGAAVAVGLFVATMATRHLAAPASAGTSGSHRTMLVVLPPQSLGDSADAAFADGLGDEITTRLASLSGLGVIGRASALRYRDTPAPPREIARELGADYVLLTTVRWDRARSQPRIRVTSQLVRAADQTSAWSDSYDADLSGVFEVQGTVAAKIAEAMGVRLASADRDRLAAVPTRNPEALRYYLRGRDLRRQVYIGYEDREQDAIRAFTEATRLDSGFAAAHAGLAEALLGDWATAAQVTRADSVVHVALRLDPTLPEARAALAGVLLARGYPDSAIAELEHAHATRPGSAEILRALGVALRERAGLDSSLRVLAEAVRLDPRSAETLTEACRSAYAVSLDSAGVYCARTVRLEPDLFVGYLALAWRSHLEADQRGVDSIISRFAKRVGVRAAIAHFAGIPQFFLSFPSAYDTVMMNLSSTDVAALGLFTTHALVARRLGRIATMNADLDSAVARAEAALRRRDTLPEAQAAWIEASLGWGRGLQGRQQEALELTRRALARKPAGLSWYLRTQMHAIAAQTFTLAGDADAAVDELEVQLRQPWLITRTRLRRDPFWDPLRSKPRFRRLISEYPS
jgi:serine/threonine protein kinase/tetratricopeptide (TPR) repeat protein